MMPISRLDTDISKNHITFPSCNGNAFGFVTTETVLRFYTFPAKLTEHQITPSCTRRPHAVPNKIFQAIWIYTSFSVTDRCIYTIGPKCLVHKKLFDVTSHS